MDGAALCHLLLCFTQMAVGPSHMKFNSTSSLYIDSTIRCLRSLQLLKADLRRSAPSLSLVFAASLASIAFPALARPISFEPFGFV